jgi:hypothetical protein
MGEQIVDWISQTRPEFFLALVAIIAAYLITRGFKKFNKITLPGVSLENTCSEHNQKKGNKGEQGKTKHCKHLDEIMATINKIIEVTSQKTLQVMTILQEQMDMIDSQLLLLKDEMTNIFRDTCSSDPQKKVSLGVEQAVRIYSLCWSECVLTIYNIIKADFMSDRFKSAVKDITDSETYLSISKNMAKTVWTKICTIFSSNYVNLDLPSDIMENIHNQCENSIEDRVEKMYAKAKDIYNEKIKAIQSCDNELHSYLEGLNQGVKR